MHSDIEGVIIYDDGTCSSCAQYYSSEKIKKANFNSIDELINSTMCQKKI